MARTEIKKLNNNALARRLQAEQFFTQAEKDNPQALIDAHEKWLRGELDMLGVPIDNRTWNHFHDNAIAASLGQKLPYSLRTVERRTFESIGNITQALAWFHSPQEASWNSPQINFPIKTPTFVNHEMVIAAITAGEIGDAGRWFAPMTKYKSYIRGYSGIGISEEAPFVFEVNEHYEGVQGSLSFNDCHKEFRGIKATYDNQTNILQVSFGNPNDFMGWYEEQDGKLVYRLTKLNEFLTHLTGAIAAGKEEVIAVDTWRAY